MARAVVESDVVASGVIDGHSLLESASKKTLTTCMISQSKSIELQVQTVPIVREMIFDSLESLHVLEAKSGAPHRMSVWSSSGVWSQHRLSCCGFMLAASLDQITSGDISWKTQEHGLWNCKMSDLGWTGS